jgi:hypothetical protein
MPQLLTFVLYVTGLWHKELYLLLFGFGMSGSTLLNWALNEATSDRVLPRVLTCVPVHGAVLSFESQQTAFFVTFVLGYIALYEAQARIWHLLLLVSLFALVFLGDHLLNYHTAEAIVAATTLGSALAFCYQWLLYVAIVPTFPRAMRSRLVRFFGYDDTLCYTSGTSALGRFVLRGFDERYGNASDETLVQASAVCILVRERVHEYLTREHTIFRARDIVNIDPLLVCELERTPSSLTVYRARQSIEEYF